MCDIRHGSHCRYQYNLRYQHWLSILIFIHFPRQISQSDSALCFHNYYPACEFTHIWSSVGALGKDGFYFNNSELAFPLEDIEVLIGLNCQNLWNSNIVWRNPVQAGRPNTVCHTEKYKKNKGREELQKSMLFIISSLIFITMRWFKGVIIYLGYMMNYRKSVFEINVK